MNGNGKITLAKVEQNLQDCQKYHGDTLTKIERNQAQLVEEINKITNILTRGDGKIARNYGLITEHMEAHKREKYELRGRIKLYLTVATLLITAVSVSLAFIR